MEITAPVYSIQVLRFHLLVSIVVKQVVECQLCSANVLFGWLELQEQSPFLPLRMAVWGCFSAPWKGACTARSGFAIRHRCNGCFFKAVEVWVAMCSVGRFDDNILVKWLRHSLKCEEFNIC